MSVVIRFALNAECSGMVKLSVVKFLNKITSNGLKDKVMSVDVLNVRLECRRLKGAII